MRTTLLMVAVLLLAACGQPETIKIGYIGPLTGPFATFGNTQVKAIKLGLEDLNYEIQGKKIELIIEDSKAEPSSALTAAKKLVEIDGVKAIIGPMSSSPAMAVKEYLDQVKIPAISPIATTPYLGDQDDYLFRTMPDTRLQTKFLAEFAEKTNISATAIIFVNNDFGKGSVEYFSKAYKGKITQEQSHETFDSDFHIQATKVLNENAVFLASYPKHAGMLVSQLRELGFNGTIFGIETLGVPDSIIAGGSAMDNVVFATPKKLTAQDFEGRFQAKYDETTQFSTDTAYDAFIIIAKSLEYCEKDLKECIQETGQKYEGVSGLIDFNQFGDVDKPFSLFRFDSTIPIEIEIN